MLPQEVPNKNLTEIKGNKEVYDNRCQIKKTSQDERPSPNWLHFKAMHGLIRLPPPQAIHQPTAPLSPEAGGGSAWC